MALGVLPCRGRNPLFAWSASKLVKAVSHKVVNCSGLGNMFGVNVIPEGDDFAHSSAVWTLCWDVFSSSQTVSWHGTCMVRQMYRHPTITMEDLAASETHDALPVFEVLDADSARPVVTIKDDRGCRCWWM